MNKIKKGLLRCLKTAVVSVIPMLSLFLISSFCCPEIGIRKINLPVNGDDIRWKTRYKDTTLNKIKFRFVSCIQDSISIVVNDSFRCVKWISCVDVDNVRDIDLFYQSDLNQIESTIKTKNECIKFTIPRGFREVLIWYYQDKWIIDITNYPILRK